MADARAATIDLQVAELIAALESQLVPLLDPLLAETLLAAIAAIRQRGDAALSGRVMVTVGGTYETIRELIDRFGDRLLAVIEEIGGLRQEQESVASALRTQATAFRVHTEAIESLVLIHAAHRLATLESRADDMAGALRGVEDRVAHLLRAQGVGEATAPHTG